MTTKPSDRHAEVQARTSSLRRRATGLTLGVLLASFATVAVNSGATPSSSAVAPVSESGAAAITAATTKPAAPSAQAPTAAAPSVRQPAPPQRPQASQPTRRARTRQS